MSVFALVVCVLIASSILFAIISQAKAKKASNELHSRVFEKNQLEKNLNLNISELNKKTEALSRANDQLRNQVIFLQNRVEGHQHFMEQMWQSKQYNGVTYRKKIREYLDSLQ